MTKFKVEKFSEFLNEGGGMPSKYRKKVKPKLFTKKVLFNLWDRTFGDIVQASEESFKNDASLWMEVQSFLNKNGEISYIDMRDYEIDVNINGKDYQTFGSYEYRISQGSIGIREIAMDPKEELKINYTFGEIDSTKIKEIISALKKYTK